ncbi:SGNH/GDSL hydrolase family protein [Alkalinema sp. FACHB-956]|uniref:SGNH/GDSL hydrolase family protein n=1 Tax=Alkalinema sp. FACHB-956 TaxID=2692768 RepID=UPI00168A3734|nr:SGNH/GDSL hydrolase family protein [Alkalinema sp. FACHB-956]MBD2326739.1 SGNH/GDSL hydrolase family protein [Alkalinema sp. FACHB-956]
MKLLLGAIAILLALLGIEIFLRVRFGFGHPLLYLADPEMGYRLAPNQTVKRFGNTIAINQYSMRSGEITPERSPTTFRILLLGDSVANGGWWTDQSQTISTLLQVQLQTQIQTQVQNPAQAKGNLSAALQRAKLSTIEVLNASANSWSPRSEFPYLKQFGTFESQRIVLIINTDDLFATAPTDLVVGHDRNYPDRLPFLALEEVITRYVLPAPKLSPQLQAVYAEGGDRVGRNLQAIDQIHQMAQQHQAQLLVILTPLLREIETGSRNYEIDARQRLAQFLQDRTISFIDCLPHFQAQSSPRSLYHDHIHLNPQGNQQISDQIQQWLQQLQI